MESSDGFIYYHFVAAPSLRDSLLDDTSAPCRPRIGPPQKPICNLFVCNLPFIQSIRRKRLQIHLWRANTGYKPSKLTCFLCSGTPQMISLALLLLLRCRNLVLNQDAYKLLAHANAQEQISLAICIAYAVPCSRETPGFND